MIFTFSAYGAEQCPDINCDCASLPSNEWVLVCANYEAHIKKECVANANTPKSYCSIHGLNAKPLPLSIQMNEPVPATEDDYKALNKTIASLYWAIYTDIGEAKEAFDLGEFSKTMQILKLIDNNIANLFVKQREVDAYWLAQNNTKRITKSWNNYSTDTLAFADKLYALSKTLTVKLNSATEKKEQQIFSVLSIQTLRMAGTSYEQSGYAFGRANDHDKAAKTWQKASGLSVELAAIARNRNASTSGVMFNEFQASARLQRASYHRLRGNEKDDAKKLLSESQAFANKLLRESQAFANREEQKRIQLLVDKIEGVSETGALSER